MVGICAAAKKRMGQNEGNRMGFLELLVLSTHCFRANKATRNGSCVNGFPIPAGPLPENFSFLRLSHGWAIIRSPLELGSRKEIYVV